MKIYFLFFIVGRENAMIKIIMRALFLCMICFILLIISASFVFQARADQEELVPPDFCVSGIMFDSQEPMAIINDVLVKEGEEIDGANILKITDSKVEFSYKGKIFAKEIGQDSVGALDTPANRYLRADNSLNLQVFEKMRQMASFAWVSAILIILLYAYSAICLQRIAIKTQTENPWLAWIPIANLYLCYLIAKSAVWWFILLFIPCANIVASVVIWTRIAKARHKSKWLGVLMLLPLVNFCVMGYLAFSD